MTHWKRAGSILAVAIGLAGTALLPQAAEAHGRGRGGFGGRGGAYFGGFYGFSPFFGYGFGPYWAPYWGPYAGPYFRPEGGVDMNAAMIAGFGAVDLDVKPGQAEVWVDGRYVGEARDLDGYPSYLWLEQGAHKLAIYKGGYLTFEEDIDVQRGMRTELRVRLEKGDSPRPGPTPDEGKKES